MLFKNVTDYQPLHSYERVSVRRPTWLKSEIFKKHMCFVTLQT